MGRRLDAWARMNGATASLRVAAFQGLSAAMLAGMAAWWAFWDQRDGSALQLTLQVLLPVLLVAGMGVSLVGTRTSPRWWLPFGAYAAGLPALLASMTCIGV